MAAPLERNHPNRHEKRQAHHRERANTRVELKEILEVINGCSK